MKRLPGGRCALLDSVARRSSTEGCIRKISSALGLRRTSAPWIASRTHTEPPTLVGALVAGGSVLQGQGSRRLRHGAPGAYWLASRDRGSSGLVSRSTPRSPTGDLRRLDAPEAAHLSEPPPDAPTWTPLALGLLGCAPVATPSGGLHSISCQGTPRQVHSGTPQAGPPPVGESPCPPHSAATPCRTLQSRGFRRAAPRGQAAFLPLGGLR